MLKFLLSNDEQTDYFVSIKGICKFIDTWAALRNFILNTVTTYQVS